VGALDKIGDEASTQVATLMMSLAACYLLTRVGPVAARNAMIAAYANLTAAIEAQNCGSTALS
jgi:hypothetical protein